jgi:hypothetical protein
MPTGDEDESEYTPGVTPYHELTDPELHTDFFLAWQRLTTTVDEELWQSGPKSERPADPPTGRFYAATDERIIYRYGGEQWDEFAGVGATDSGSGDGGDTLPLGEHLIRAPNYHLQDSELQNGKTIRQRVSVPAGQTLTVYLWGVEDTAGGTPSGLLVELRDPTGSVVADANTAKRADTSGLAAWENTASTRQTAVLAVVNETGSDYSAPDSGVSARFGYEVA